MEDLRALTRMLGSARDEFLALYGEYEEMWVRVATSTEPADRPAAAEAIRTAYRTAGKDDNIRFVWFDSLPAMELGYRIALMAGDCSSLSQEWKWRLAPDMPRALWEAMAPSWQTLLGAASLGEFRRERSLSDGFDALLRSFMGYSGRQVSFQQLERGSPYAPLAAGLAPCRVAIAVVATAWFCHHVFSKGDGRADGRFLEACVVAARSCLWWCPFEGVVVLCDRPAELHLKEGRLHRDGGPAVRWRDGILTWSLNGVLVPKAVAEMPSDRLDAHLVLQESNGDVLREIVRKIGVERLCRDLGAECVDRAGDYELLMLPLWHGWRVPYLKMINPSTGTCHIEGVHPDCKTVAEALAWRNESARQPVALT